MLGSSLRHLIGEVVPPTGNGWPVATFVVNSTGALLLGVVVGRLIVRHTGRLGGLLVGGTASGDERLRAFLGTGVLGSYTTFSAFAVDIGVLVDEGRVAVAGSYGVLTLAAGVALARVGLSMGSRRA